MTDSYKVGYSVDALDDLREIYSYIANELLVPETASAQLSRIRKEVRSLDFMPARYALVDWEPWHSMKMHQLPVDNFIVYYLVIAPTANGLEEGSFSSNGIPFFSTI